MSINRINFSQSRRGAILPLVAILLPILLLLAGFAINIAYMQLTATEIKISTDIAARAAGRTFAITQDEAEALRLANEAGSLNRVAGDALVFAATDLVFGNAIRPDVSSRYGFTTGGGQNNAVQVTGNRNSDSANGAVSTFLPTFMGVTSFNISASSISTQMEVDIVLVFDRSGSMAYADNEPAVYPPKPAAAPTGWDFGDPAPNNSRWLDAVAATNLFLSKLTASPLSEHVALVTYADMGQIDTPITDSYGEISAGLGTYTNSLDGGGTNIAGGLQAGDAALSAAREYSAKVIIVMTDGHRTVGPSPVANAIQLADKGVMVICVTFSDEADQALMRTVAEEGNGFHLHANSSADLEQVFEKIARSLPTLLTK